jgi:hypothetical protein
MKKEQWINDIFETASEIKEVEAGPYLYQKIISRLHQPEESSATIWKFKLEWALAFFLVIAINISSFVVFKTKMKKEKEQSAIQALSGEISFNTLYNY